MKELIMLYPWSIMLVVLVLVLILILYYSNRKREAARLTYEFIVIAEKLILGESNGGKKLSFVYEHLYPILPKILRLVYSKAQVYQFIDKVFEINKKRLEDYIRVSNIRYHSIKTVSRDT